MLGRFLVFVGGLLVVALFAALLAPFFVNWTDFRGNFEQRASRILGKKVTVNGAVEARILPFPSVTLHDVTVGRGEDGLPLVSVARFSMDVELAPFLSGEARIFDMRIEEPKIRVKLFEDGTLDWLRGSRSDIPARNVVLENVHISDGELEFVDEQTGRTRHLSGLDAEMSARSLAGPFSVDGRATLDGEAGGFHLSSLLPNEETGGVPLRLRLTPDKRPFEIELDGDFGIKDGKPGYAGQFQARWTGAPDKTDADRAATPEPRVKGEFELSNERVRVPSYRLELGDGDNPYAVTGEATLDTGARPEFLLTADGQQIDVNRIGNEGAAGKTDRNAVVSVRQRLDRLVEIASGIPIPKVPGRASLSLPAVVAGDTVVRDIKLDVRPAGDGWAIDNAVAVLPGRTQIEAKGRLKLSGEPSFNGEMLVASTQPTGLASWLSGSVDPAIRQLKSAGFSALVDLTPELQRFDKLELAVGPATLKGRVERQSFENSDPNLTFDLTGNAIDLDAMRALVLMVAGEESGDSLFSHRIAARLKVDSLTAAGVEARGVDTIFTLDNGAVSLEKFNIADLAGATVVASGRGDGSLFNYGGSGSVSISAADPGPLLDIVRHRLPGHPLLDLLAESAPWYANSKLTAEVTFGETNGGGLRVRVGGTANGSRIDANFGVADFLDPEGAMQLDASIDNDDTSILLGQAGLRPLPLPADNEGHLAVSVRRDARGPADTTLTFVTDRTTLKASGSMTFDEHGDFAGAGKVAIDSVDFDPYLIMNGIALPQMLGGMPLKGSADIAINGATVDVTAIDAVAAGNTISGALTLGWAGDAPKADGQLKLDTLDLSWLAENLFGTIADPLTGEIAQSALVPPSWGSAEAAIKLEAGTFTTGAGEAIRDFSADLGLKAGSLLLDGMRGSWFGGAASGRIMLVNGEGTGFGELRLDVSDGDIAGFYGTAAERAPASGRFDLALAAETSGKSVDELLSSINGSGSLGLKDLSIGHFDLGLFEPLLAAADLLANTEITQERVEPLVRELLGEAPVSVGEVAVPFNISGGTARMQNVSATAAQARLDADAKLDLRQRALDGSVTVTLDPGEEALEGTQPSFRLSLKGDPFAPEAAYDVTEVTNYLSLRAFERERRRVETLQSNVLEKQRLRREVLLYRFNARQRQLAREKAQALDAAVTGEEARLRALAAERAGKRRQAEAARKAAADAARIKAEQEAVQPQSPSDPAAVPQAPEPTLSVPTLPVAPGEAVTRGGRLLPPGGLKFEDLPGVQ